MNETINWKAFFKAVGVTLALYAAWLLVSFIPGFFTFMALVGCFAVGWKLFDIYIYLYDYWNKND